MTLSETDAPVQSVPLFVGGEWRPGGDGETVPDTSPATGAVIADVAQGTREDARAAVAAARDAADAWRRASAF
jgi:acyl-CoA reductase-like NAD-dependent aldehyde dehydrogenase